MTTSPDGEQVQAHDRLAEFYDRYGAGHLVSRSIPRLGGLILEAVGHVYTQPLHLIGQWPLALAAITRVRRAQVAATPVTIATDACRMRHRLPILVTCWSCARIASAATGTSTRPPRTC